MSIRNLTLTSIALLTSVALFATGCGSSDAPAPQGGKQGAPRGAHVHKEGEPHYDGDGHDQMAEGKETAHSGWWCPEHGVPEAVCSICNSQVAAVFQKKGDWCADHDRAKSQCFICEPSLKEKFAAQYRAKEGKEPPPIEEEAEAKDGKKS